MDKLLLIFLGVWALLTGLVLVTNVRIDVSPAVTGIAALCCGVVAIIRAVK